MASVSKILVAARLMFLSMATWAADDLSQILSMMEQNVAIHCESRRVLSQYQKTRDPAEQSALERRLNEVNKRRDDADRSLQANNFEAMARALPKADQLKMQEHAIALAQRCNATLPPDARISTP
jgi:hypothetical protein